MKTQTSLQCTYDDNPAVTSEVCAQTPVFVCFRTSDIKNSLPTGGRKVAQQVKAFGPQAWQPEPI